MPLLLLGGTAWAGATSGKWSDPPPLATLARHYAELAHSDIHEESATLKTVLRDSRRAADSLRVRRRLLAAGKAAVLPVVEAIRSSPEPERTSPVLKLLAELDGREALPALRRMLSDESADIALRRRIPACLGRLGGPEDVRLLDGLARGTDFQLAQAAVFALGSLRSHGGLAAVRTLLEEGRPGVRAAAAEVLGNCEDEESIPRLLLRLSDADPYVRTFAHGALCELTYHSFTHTPGDPRGAANRWAAWWSPRSAWSRERLLASTLADHVAVAGSSDPSRALEAAHWLAALTFQPVPDVAVPALEAARWRTWHAAYGRLTRAEWFRQAVDGLVGRLSHPEPAVSWQALWQLHEWIDRAEEEPYLFRVAWSGAGAEARRRFAGEYREWWSRSRAGFDPRGRRFW